MARFAKLAVLLLSYMGSSMAEFEYLPTPEKVLETVVPGGIIGESNMVAVAPDNKKLFVTFDNGGLNVVDISSATPTPTLIEAPAATFKSNSGVYFSGDASEYYAVYTIYDTENDATHVRKVGMDGAVVWTSGAYPGLQSGTPAGTADGKYIMFTCGQSFVVIKSEDGEPLFTQNPKPAGVNAPGPFSPVGFFHNPEEGWYSVSGGGDDVGENNINDVFLWGHKHDPTADAGTTGAMYAFQFPKLWDGDEDNIGDFAVTFVSARGWTVEDAPLIASDGRSAYFSTNRNMFRAWVADGPPYTDTSSKWHNSASFTTINPGRGDPAYISPFTTPVVAGGVMLSGVATPGAYLLSAEDGSPINGEELPTSDLPLSARPLVAFNNDQFYYIDRLGVFYNIDTTGEEVYKQDYGVTPVFADASLSSDGQVVYFGTLTGTVIGVKVAKDDTASPSAAPTVSSPPSAAPSATASDMPSGSPTAAPTAPPTAVDTTPAPTPDSTPAPTPAPIPADTPAPTPAPTEETSGAAAPFAAILTVCAAVGVSLFL